MWLNRNDCAFSERSCYVRENALAMWNTVFICAMRSVFAIWREDQRGERSLALTQAPQWCERPRKTVALPRQEERVLFYCCVNHCLTSHYLIFLSFLARRQASNNKAIELGNAPPAQFALDAGFNAFFLFLSSPPSLSSLSLCGHWLTIHYPEW